MGIIEKLIEVLEAQTVAINKMIEMSGGKPVKTASEGPKAEAPKAKPGPKPKPKGATVETIAEAFGSYLSTKDKAEREVRKTNVKAILDYFTVGRATDIPADNYEEALRYLQQYVDGETPDFDSSGGGEEDGESLV